MIDVLLHGRLIKVREIDGHAEGRIALEDDSPIQFAAHRGSIKAQLLAMPFGYPLAVAGRLTTSVGTEKRGGHFVRHDVLITSILTVQPSPLRSGWRALTGAFTHD